MRMDRYEDIKKIEPKPTRTNKNQELYTDVYLNNVYVDINNLKEVMQSEKETIDIEKENLKTFKETKIITSYEDKNYDIRQLITEAIIKKGDDKIKRSIDTKVDDLEIKSLIESINETKEENNKEQSINENKNDNLLIDLLPNDENTNVIPPLSKPLTKDDIKLPIDEVKNELEIDENDFDKSFLEKKYNYKVIFLILGILIFFALIFAFLLAKDLI